MMPRNRLPNRRRSENFNIEVGGQTYIVTVGYYNDDTPAEIFLNCARVTSFADVNAADGAVAVSIALQHGASIQTIREAMKRDVEGKAQGPLGAALDEI